MTTITQDKPRFVDRITPKRPSTLSEPAAVSLGNQPTYEAITETRGQQRASRFKIILPDQTSYGCSYAQLLNWIYLPPDGLQIITPSYQFDIEGTGLEKLDMALLNEKLSILRAFHPQLHQHPAAGEPLIEAIRLLAP